MKHLKNCLFVLIVLIVLFLAVGQLVLFYCNKEIKQSTKSVVKQQVDISNDQLIRAVMGRIWTRYRKYKNGRDMLKNMSYVEKTVYCSGYFYLEMNGNGFLDYFKKCPDTAPYLLDALSEIKANGYRELVYDFVHKNKLDLNELGEFHFYDDSKNQELYDKYSFGELEEKYQKINKNDKLEDYLGDYIRKYIVDL